MAPQSHTAVITAECLCKTHTFSTEVSVSQLPLEGNVCHCDSCRHSTGALYVAVTIWPQPRAAFDIAGLQSYEFSPNITYRFCGTCSTLMFYETKKYPSQLGVFTGTLRNIDTDLVRHTKHIYVEDTKDGGASVWLKKPNSDGNEVPRYRERSGGVPWDLPCLPASAGPEGQRGEEPLPISCHCKGVQLLLHGARYASMERGQVPWFIDPRTNKSLASFDVCDSCRLQFGVDIVNWTFTDLADISQANGGAFPKDMAEMKAAVDMANPEVGTLGYYQSSPGAQRYFCKRCSASVFYICDSRPEIADVAIGLLESPDGARAERYLSWTLGDALMWVDDTRGGWREGLMKRVQADAEEFRIASNYPVSWRRLAQEDKAGSS